MYTDIKVGYTCNNNCVHCVIAPIKKNLIKNRNVVDSNTNEVKQFIDEAKKRGSRSIVLTGGEVTIRSDFEELVQYVVNKNLHLTIQTNGRVLSKPGRLNFLEGLPPINFVVAIHGHNENIHDSITRAKNSFRQTVAAIECLRKYSNAIIHGKLVISKINMIHLPATSKLLADLEIKKLTVAFPHAEDFSMDEFKKVVPRYSELQPYLNETIDCCCNYNMSVVFETIPYCVFPNRLDYWKHSLDANLSMYGKLNPGFIQATGNTEISDWERVRKTIKYKGDRCHECVFDKACEGPWREYVDVFGDQEFIPISDIDIVSKL